MMFVLDSSEKALTGLDTLLRKVVLRKVLKVLHHIMHCALRNMCTGVDMYPLCGSSTLSGGDLCYHLKCKFNGLPFV